MSSDAEKSYERKQGVGVDVLGAETENIYTEDALDPVYQAKARILNDALQEIGMGRYQASASHAYANQLCQRIAVVSLRRRRVWLVRVRSSSGMSLGDVQTDRLPYPATIYGQCVVEPSPRTAGLVLSH
jgi:hypothetical protein